MKYQKRSLEERLRDRRIKIMEEVIEFVKLIEAEHPHPVTANYLQTMIGSFKYYEIRKFVLEKYKDRIFFNSNKQEWKKKEQKRSIIKLLQMQITEEAEKREKEKN